MLEKYKRRVMRKPEKLVIEGEAGAGKTTFACQSHSKKEPAFVINADDGGEHVFHKTGIEYIHDCIPTGDVKENAEKWDGVMSTLRELATEKSDIKRVIIDSVDKLEILAQGRICVDHKLSHIEDMGYGKGFSYVRGAMQKMLSGLNYLRDTQSIQPVLICHTQVRTINKPTMEPYDSFVLKLHKSLCADVMEWADVILFVAFETIVKKIDSGFNRKDSRAIQSGKRFLYTSGSMGVDAKNRFDLPPEIPADWNGYQKLINNFWEGNNSDNTVTQG
tara:strand:- start:1136 stop:1963 length:828 start_codon:yes stop_codon:yes gene_type:complete